MGRKKMEAIEAFDETDFSDPAPLFSADGAHVSATSHGATGEPRIEYVPLAELESSGWPGNPKKHDIDTIVASIERFGFVSPMLMDEKSGRIVAGHGRAEALGYLRAQDNAPPRGIRVEAGAWLVPVLRGVDFDSEQEAEAYLLADNQLGALGGWDNKRLVEMLGHVENWDGTGYTEDDLTSLLMSLNTAPLAGVADVEPQIDRAGELREKWGVEVGQLWALGDHLLLCGDSTKRADVDRLMGGNKASVCLTDPPYGLGGKVTYDAYNDSRENLEALARAWLPIAREVAPVVCFSPGVTNAWIYPEASWVMCWFYGGGQLRSSWGFNCWQPFLCYGKDPSLGSGNGCRPDAVDMNTPANAGDIDHPCPKPLKLWAWFIERLSFAARDVFYDPFSGAGTTLIACEQLGKVSRSIELSPGYVAVTLQRFSDATGKVPLLLSRA